MTVVPHGLDTVVFSTSLCDFHDGLNDGDVLNVHDGLADLATVMSVMILLLL